MGQALTNGYGKSVTVDSNAQQLILNTEHTGFFANRVSVLNLGSARIRARVNIGIADFEATSGNACIIPNGTQFTFTGDGFPPMSSIVLAAESGSSEVIINAF